MFGASFWFRTRLPGFSVQCFHQISLRGLLVLPPRIELGFHPYQGCVMPLYYESIIIHIETHSQRQRFFHRAD